MGGWAARSRALGEAGPGCVRAACLLICWAPERRQPAPQGHGWQAWVQPLFRDGGPLSLQVTPSLGDM